MLLVLLYIFFHTFFLFEVPTTHFLLETVVDFIDFLFIIII